MLYYLGLIFIVLFNMVILYDLTQNNEEIYKSNFSLFMYVIVFFCLTEILLFTLVYFFVIHTIGLLA